jgi:asparagine synthase (glutamine-hydrolysing)
MCGIAGTYAYASSASPIDRDELRRVRDHMRARGPDGEGEWFSEDGRVGFGHRRLAIIDLSESGAQPMQSVNRRFVITFNGEIYNYRELRHELERAGCSFASNSDTEVILHLFERYGAEMLTRLRGMFAFAIWDQRERRLFLARDPFGIKPLYFSDDGKTLRFASQVKALLQSAVDRAPDSAGHAGFFIWGSVPEPWTLYKSIRALPAGTYLIATVGHLSAPTAFTDIAEVLRRASNAPASCSENEAKEAIAFALKDTVRAHHVADVPVGLFLSAGLDSGLLAHLAPGPRSEVQTVTLGFNEYRGKSEDESLLAERVAKALGVSHTTVAISRTDFEEDGEKLFTAMDQPSIDGVNTWFVSRAARSRGLKVALSGVGGDELFASYDSFRDVPRIVAAAKRYRWLTGSGRLLRRVSAPIVRRLASPKFASLAEYGGSYAGAYLLRRALYLPWELNDGFCVTELRTGIEALALPRALDAIADGHAVARSSVSALEMSAYMRNQLLRDTDWASMAHSLEVRTPLVDWKLLNDTAPYLAAHPSLTKAAVFSAAAPALPSEILTKPKTGFVVPVRQWLSRTSDVGRHGSRDWSHRVADRFMKSALA